MPINFNRKLLSDIDDAIVCCSGGSDSIAAAHFLSRKGIKSLSVFHFHHQLRRQNDEMFARVAKFCTIFNLNFLPLTAKDFKIDLVNGLEAGARNARIDACSFLAKKIGCNHFIQAHHLDDAIESHIMNTVQGKARKWPINPITKFTDFTVIRPFLLTDKKDFSDYCLRNNLMEFVEEDETNTDIKYNRNYVRHVILPTIKRRYGIKKVVRKIYLQTGV